MKNYKIIVSETANGRYTGNEIIKDNLTRGEAYKEYKKKYEYKEYIKEIVSKKEYDNKIIEELEKMTIVKK